jgi:hypothetical protein
LATVICAKLAGAHEAAGLKSFFIVGNLKPRLEDTYLGTLPQLLLPSGGRRAFATLCLLRAMDTDRAFLSDRNGDMPLGANPMRFMQRFTRFLRQQMAWYYLEIRRSIRLRRH